VANIELHSADECVAIIGIACRFPGARNVEEYWNNLVQGVESISFFSDEELLAAGVDEDVLRQPDYVKARGVLGDAEYLDAHFFGFTPREAEILDPQHRVFLECAWHALEDAGYDPERTRARIGVFGGAATTYHLYQLEANHEVKQYASGISIVTGNDKDYLTTRVSYKLNLRGPSVDVQCACSTSLVAVLLGVHSLLSYQSDLVLAGGVSIIPPEKRGYVYQQGGLVSPDGHCRAFDARAQGTVFSSGAGVVLLRRFSEALQDGDHIYAVIKGGAINNDGALKTSYTAPGVEGQVEVAVEALAMAGVTPDTLSYYETHGTGTQIGDPIEIAALTEVFRSYTDKKQFCAIGSVKTNIGHTDVAAGVAGLIKTALALEYRQIPPTLHFERPNPEIDFENSPFYVNTKLTEWRTNGSPLRAGVGAFGVGGTNASAILEAPPAIHSGASTRPYKVLVLSAKTESALQAMTLNLKEHLERHAELNLDDAAYTLQVGRRVFEHRRFIVSRDRDKVLTALGDPASRKVFTTVGEGQDSPVVFMFPGQGTQYVNMGLELYRSEPIFREQVDTCCELLEPELGFDLCEVLYPAPDAVEEAADKLNQTVIAQPALFVIGYALAKLWMSWGVKPEAMIGHSVGEYVAACLSGVFALEDALKAVAVRGKLVQELPEGSMLAVLLSEQELAPMLGSPLAMAAVNGPALTVVSGPIPNILQLEQVLKARSIPCKRLATSHAFHSEMMEPILEPFSKLFASISLHAPTIPFLSTVTGTWITEKEARDPDYWVRHVRQTVRFSDGILELLKGSSRVFLEVGPGRSLQSGVKRHLDRASNRAIIGSLRDLSDRHSDAEYLAIALGYLWSAGVNIAWSDYYRNEQRRRISLPGYPFERKRFWVEPAKRALDVAHQREKSTKKADVGEWFYMPSWKRTAPPEFLQQDGSDEQRTCWALFIDEQGLGAEIAEQLKQDGHEVICIQRGKSFKQSNDWNFTIDVGERSHYDLVFGGLKNEGAVPTKLIHLWNITALEGNPLGWSEAERSETLSFYSLLFMEQALIKQNMVDDLHITVVTNGMFDVSGDAVQCPEKALVLGPCRVFRNEYPKIQCRAVDVVLPTIKPEREALARKLILETTVCSTDAVAAYRGGHRWTQAFEPTYLGAPDGLGSRLRENGVYLITGGLGGLGLAVARFLVEAVGAKLILVHRSPLPEREQWQDWLDTHSPDDPISQKIQGVRALEEAGAGVLLYRTDVADFYTMQQMVQHATQRFGTINGVFHAAGVPGAGVIALKTTEMAERVLEPKVKGTLVLNAVLGDSKLDFFVLFSSITSILGEAGQVDYCAANAFMDAFAHLRNSRHIGSTTSLNWGRWGEVGMAVRLASTGSVLSENWEDFTETSPHPFLSHMMQRNGEEIYLAHLHPRDDWVISSHRLFGVPTLVGITYLEMARAVAQAKAPNDTVVLQNVYFITPLMVDSDKQKLLRLTTRQANGIRQFVFKSQQRGGHEGNVLWQDHVIGEMHSTAGPSPTQHDLGQLISKLKDNIDTTPFFRLVGDDLDPPMLELGPRWDCLVQTCVGQNEWLGRIELPEEFHKDLEYHPLHPAMLDVATLFGIRYITRAPYLPLGYRRLTIHAPLTPTIYSYVRLRNEPGRVEQDEIISFDVVIMTPQGEELINIEGYTLKRVHEALLTGSQDLWRGPAASSTDVQTASNSSPASSGKSGDPTDILPNEGIEALRRYLGAGAVPQLVVCTRDFPSLIEETFSSSEPDGSQDDTTATVAKPTHSRPHIATPYVEPTNEVEKAVAEVWQSVLGIDMIGMHDNFMELGGNSLLAIQAMSRTVDSFQVELTIENFYRDPTVAGIAEVIVEQLTSLVDVETLEQMLSEIEQLPDE